MGAAGFFGVIFRCGGQRGEFIIADHIEAGGRHPGGQATGLCVCGRALRAGLGRWHYCWAGLLLLLALFRALEKAKGGSGELEIYDWIGKASIIFCGQLAAWVLWR